MKKYPFIVIDTETTGLDADDEIIEFAAVGSDQQILWHSLVKPVRHTEWPEAQAINKISPDDVEFALTAAEQKLHISEVLSSCKVVVGYNVKFDLRMLTQSGIALPEDLVCMDVMDLVVGRFGHRLSLSKLCAELGVVFSQDGPHSATSDALATLQALSVLTVDPFSFPYGSEETPLEKPDQSSELLSDRKTSENFMRFSYVI